MFPCRAQISWCFPWVPIPDFLSGYPSAESLCWELINSDVLAMPPSSSVEVREKELLAREKEPLCFLHLPCAIQKAPQRVSVLRFPHFWHAF